LKYVLIGTGKGDSYMSLNFASLVPFIEYVYNYIYIDLMLIYLCTVRVQDVYSMCMGVGFFLFGVFIHVYKFKKLISATCK